MKILAFIPARGGSKGIKKKNIVKIGNKRLIDFTIETVKKLPKNCKLFISTDSSEIINHCKKFGYINNYKRPKLLSTDKSKTIDSVFHALNWLENNENYIPDAVLLLQPTSPFRNILEIKKAINKFKRDSLLSIFGVVKMKTHPSECISISKNIWKFLKKNNKQASRRQEYESNFYFIDGSFYLASTSFIKKHKSFIVEKKSLPFIFNNENSIDIDTIIDLRLARQMYKYN